MRGILIYDILQGKAKGCFAISDCQYPACLFVSATEYCKVCPAIPLFPPWPPVNNRQTQKPLSIVCEIFKCPWYAASAKQDRQIKSQSWSRISMEREYEVVPERIVLWNNNINVRQKTQKREISLFNINCIYIVLATWQLKKFSFLLYKCFTMGGRGTL